MSESAEAVAKAFMRAINRQDVDSLAELMTEEHRFVDALGNVVAGQDRMRRGFPRPWGRGWRGCGSLQHHFAPVFVFQLQAFFHGVSIGLVDLVAKIGILNPGARLRD